MPTRHMIASYDRGSAFLGKLFFSDLRGSSTLESSEYCLCLLFWSIPFVYPARRSVHRVELSTYSKTVIG